MSNLLDERDPDFDLALRLSLEDDASDSQRYLSNGTHHENRKRSFPSNSLDLPSKKVCEDVDYQLALKLSEEINNQRSTDASVRDPDYELALKLAEESTLYKPVIPYEDITETISREDENDFLLALKISQEDVGAVKKNISATEDNDYQLALKIANSSDATPYTDESDFLLAFQISQEDFDAVDEKAPLTGANRVNKSQSRKKNELNYGDDRISVVDPSWEIIDPTPDIYALFAAFNKRFFWNKLDMVEVKWSPRMTTCAGVCRYQRRAGYCTVNLSKPLLQFRPRKDTVETLLHEMIHALLFVTNNDRDHDGHGPEFHSHMYRINKECGSNITVYHNFHEEVEFYKTHWWKCDGPCQHKPPYYGIVKRAMNRAPGPNDTWWNNHRATCGGNFIKIKEPEGQGNKNDKKSKGDKARVNNLHNYFKPITPSVSEVSRASSINVMLPSVLNNPYRANTGKNILNPMDLNTNNNPTLYRNNSNPSAKETDKNKHTQLPQENYISPF